MKLLPRHKLWILSLLSILATTVIVAGCAYAPYTGRSQIMLMSPSEELSLGAQAAQEVLQEERVSHDPRYTGPVIEVGRRIAAVAGRPDFQWEFITIDKDKANAFCLPGGKVFVYTGLFRYATRPEELAAVMGHEIGHAVARHGAERVSTALLMQLGQAAAITAIGSGSSVAVDAMKLGIGLGANVGIMLPFGRSQEYEADRIGLILMAKAGYDPRFALSFWENMSRNPNSGSMPEFLSTHPATSNRIAEIRMLLPEAMRYYQGPR